MRFFLVPIYLILVSGSVGCGNGLGTDHKGNEAVVNTTVEVSNQQKQEFTVELAKRSQLVATFSMSPADAPGVVMASVVDEATLKKAQEGQRFFAKNEAPYLYLQIRETPKIEDVFQPGVYKIRLERANDSDNIPVNVTVQISKGKPAE